MDTTNTYKWKYVRAEKCHRLARGDARLEHVKIVQRREGDPYFVYIGKLTASCMHLYDAKTLIANVLCAPALEIETW